MSFRPLFPTRYRTPGFAHMWPVSSIDTLFREIKLSCIWLCFSSWKGCEEKARVASISDLTFKFCWLNVMYFTSILLDIISFLWRWAYVIVNDVSVVFLYVSSGDSFSVTVKLHVLYSSMSMGLQFRSLACPWRFIMKIRKNKWSFYEVIYTCHPI